MTTTTPFATIVVCAFLTITLSTQAQQAPAFIDPPAHIQLQCGASIPSPPMMDVSTDPDCGLVDIL